MDGLIGCAIGRVGGDPELRFTQQGTPLLSFSIAVQDSKAKDGETQWVKVAIFGEKAEALADQVHKGGEVYVEGQPEHGRLARGPGALPSTGARRARWPVPGAGSACW